MSIKTLTTTIALVLAAGAASAQSVSSADIQLAASAGVQPGLYSQAQLIQLVEARRDNDAAAVKFILGQAGTAATRADFGAVSPVTTTGGLTAIEQVQLNDAIRDNDRATVNYILSGENRKPAESASTVTPGKAQLAALVGVDPAKYTLAQLVAMQPSTTDF